MRMPTEYQASRAVLNNMACTETQLPDGRYTPVRPLALHDLRFVERLKRAWKVFTGKADLIEWEAEC